jgi:large subunit ribosomal protein L23
VDIFQVIREPHITEKSTFQKEQANQVSFKVHRRANKIEIKHAVETIFKKKVSGVKVLNVRGKQRRFGKNTGKKSDWKKAIVRLAPNESIEFFEGM